MVAAVIFDMDGVLVDTEHLWDAVRAELIDDWGGVDVPGAQVAMMGMSSPEWSRYLHDVVGIRPAAGGDQRRGRSAAARALRDRPACRPGCGRGGRDAAPHGESHSRSRRRRTGEIIDGVLCEARARPDSSRSPSRRRRCRSRQAGTRRLSRGRAPARGRSRVTVSPSRTRRTGSVLHTPREMRVIALPNRHYPPAADALALADHTCSTDWPTSRGSSTRWRSYTRAMSTQALCPPRPIAFEIATSTSTSRASFGT